MDKKTLVAGLQAVIRKHASENRTFVLVMLIPTEPSAIDNKFTLVISAPWLDAKSPKEAVNSILSSLIDQLDSTDSPEYQKIARVTVIKSSDPFVRTITSAFTVSNGDLTIQNCNVNGVLIERATLLESHRLTNPTGLLQC
ncbi:MAG: hypothetical protein V3S24_19055 [Candidatus Tectomicrobia bacterium]